jgi:hypothetical protein
MKKLDKKNPHAVALGRNGGRARRDKLTPERRSEIARDAVEERWRKRDAKVLAAKKTRKRKVA